MYSNDVNRNALLEEHEIARLHVDVCISSPESDNLDEKQQIRKKTGASAQAIDEVVRRGFETLSDFVEKVLLDMLVAPGTPERE